MTTHFDSGRGADRAPFVVLIAATLAGVALFTACAIQQLDGHPVADVLPTLLGYGLAFVIGMPLFAASLTAAWRSVR